MTNVRLSESWIEFYMGVGYARNIRSFRQWENKVSYETSTPRKMIKSVAQFIYNSYIFGALRKL